MSFWHRLFPKAPKPEAATGLSLGEQFRRKGQNYQRLLTASDAALVLMARLQAHLEWEGYCTPTYVQLGVAAVLGYVGQAVRLLKEFTKQKEDLGEVYGRLAAAIKAELAGGLKALEGELALAALPFEGHVLPPEALLASGLIYPGREATQERGFVVEELWGWGLVGPEPGMNSRKYRIFAGQEGEPVNLAESGQETWLTYQPETGLTLEALPSAHRDRACLGSEDLQKLGQYYRVWCDFWGGPLQVGWALSRDGQIVVLGGMPWQPDDASGAEAAPEAPGGLWGSQAVTIYPGLVRGQAYRVEAAAAEGAQEMPAGAVILAANPSWELASLLDRAAALVAAGGFCHSHLAFRARERHLPAVFNCGSIAMSAPEGTLVGVDAGAREVWSGTREDMVSGEADIPAPRHGAGRELLKRLAPMLFPLQVAELPEEQRTPAACRSLHDLLFYVSEARINEMFCLSLKVQPPKEEAVSLVTGQLVPIVIIDAGGGLAVAGPTVDFQGITSSPYRALIKGMLSIPWPKGRPVDVKGFLSVIGSTTSAPRAEDQLEKISFALVSRNYMNFSLCLGYHASTIEAYTGDNPDHNYIRFHYQGGAASLERRVRRLQLIGGILSRLGFRVTVSSDLLDARKSWEAGPELLKTLKVLGRLEVYTKQMDMLMSSDGVVQGYVEDFLEKHLNEQE